MGISPKSNYEKKKSFLVLTLGKFLEALGSGIGTGSIFCLSFSLSNRVGLTQYDTAYRPKQRIMHPTFQAISQRGNVQCVCIRRGLALEDIEKNNDIALECCQKAPGLLF